MDRLIIPTAYVVLLWAVFVSGTFTIMGAEGISPRQGDIIPSILAAALLHGDYYHLFGNLQALIPLLIGLAIIDKDVGKTLLIMVLAPGIVLWTIGLSVNATHFGASDAVYALIGFLVVYGIRKGQTLSILIAVAVILFEGAKTLSGIQPSEPGVSWDGHLIGLLVGILYGAIKKTGS